jgi:hypothetical protein
MGDVVGCIALFGVIFILCVLHHFMFVTRRTVLRRLGWTAAFFAVISILVYINANPRLSGPQEGAESTRIMNDLRNLRSAALSFHENFGTWPSPGQEASLDAYLDRPIALSVPPRYAKVMLPDKPGDDDGTPELYIGVELIPKINGAKGIQEKLAKRALESGLFQGPASGDIYKSGLSVYMRIYIPAKP